MDADSGKPKRFRYGLGTRDDDAADTLVAQINELLSDRRWWSLSARPEATGRFAPKAVDIFYGAMTSNSVDSASVRENLLPYPSRELGYRRILFLGTTGSGKTTVLRQLIGTHPDLERFPTTATGRTTIADTEVVLSDGPFAAAVTFFSLDEVSAHLQDCVLQAVLSVRRGEGRAEVRRSLLRHKDERFRFNYVLGDGLTEESPTNEIALLANTSFASKSTKIEAGMPELGELPLRQTNEVIGQLIDKIFEIAQNTAKRIETDLGNAATDEDQRVRDILVEEGLEEQLRDDDDVHALKDDLVEEIRKRFDLIGDTGELTKTRQGWPESWSWATDDRGAFIRELRRFTSNSKTGFGRLLTPLVDGVRVSGPFRPRWNDGVSPKLILIDTEGLGHTVESATSISSKFTRLIAEADAVALVDSAQNPIQAAPATLLRAMARTGHGAKLHICFTHFDAVSGDNLPTDADRALHVINACDGVLARIGKDLGIFAERPLRARVRDATYFLSDCQRVLNEDTDGLTIGEFDRLLVGLQDSGDRPTLADTRPRYDRTNLVVAVRDAVEEFHTYWNARLGRTSSPDVEAAHWGSVKALSRRFAVMNQDEYQNLHPVADLQGWLQSQVWLLIQSPLEWTGGEPSDEEKQALYDELANRLSERMLDLSHERLFSQRGKEWTDAYLLSGKGSTFDRARVIAEHIYATAVPIPQSTPDPNQNEFLHRVIDLVRSTASEMDIELM
ncbi:hypothetical protein KXR83_06895 [Williamsia muralis]|uniref:hypothetical protein n=1 Tax=Williamsia marianensis TaxID=85044 RepID=UPI003F1653D2